MNTPDFLFERMRRARKATRPRSVNAGGNSRGEKTRPFIKGVNTLKPRIFTTAFSKVYPLLVQKAEKKGRSKEEVDTVIRWLTGYDAQNLQEQIDREVDIETFFAEAPQINPNAHKIKGVVCGVRVEEIEDPLMQKIRWLDKLVDELAKCRAMEKILRS